MSMNLIKQTIKTKLCLDDKCKGIEMDKVFHNIKAQRENYQNFKCLSKTNKLSEDMVT